MKGSVRDRSLHSGSVGLDTHVSIESSEPPERVRELVQMAEQTCFTLGAWTRPVPSKVTATLNGEPLEVERRDEP
jgi:hypothetical protein